MRTVTIPAAVLSLACSCLIVFACSQDTPQPLAVDSESDLPSATLAGCERAPGGLGRLPTGLEYNNTILVVTGHQVSTGTVCAVESDLYNVQIIGFTGPTGPSDLRPTIRTTLAVPTGTNICPGHRFDLSSVVGCGAEHVVVTMTPK